MPATRSKVAASISRASRSPSSIRLRLVLVTIPHQTLLAHEADAAAETREGLLLEFIGRVRGIPLVLDLRVNLVVALEELRHVSSFSRSARPCCRHCPRARPGASA